MQCILCCILFNYIFFIREICQICKLLQKLETGSMPFLSSFFFLSAFQIQICLELNSYNSLPGRGNVLRRVI